MKNHFIFKHNPQKDQCWILRFCINYIPLLQWFFRKLFLEEKCMHRWISKKGVVWACIEMCLWTFNKCDSLRALESQNLRGNIGIAVKWSACSISYLSNLQSLFGVTPIQGSSPTIVRPRLNSVVHCDTIENGVLISSILAVQLLMNFRRK